MAKKTITYYMRALHRDIGFFLIGLTVIYGISGILLIYRDTEFLKSERKIEKQLSPNIEAANLGKILHLKNFEVSKIDADIVYFQNGMFNKSTGIASYTNKALPLFLEALTNLHKKPSESSTHWFSTIFGVLLVFLAISSFWMYKFKTKQFRRGSIIAVLGFICTIIIVVI